MCDPVSNHAPLADSLWSDVEVAHEVRGFDDATTTFIRHSGLTDIILRNTDTQYLQDDPFIAYERHAAGTPAMDRGAPQFLIHVPNTAGCNHILA